MGTGKYNLTVFKSHDSYTVAYTSFFSVKVMEEDSSVCSKGSVTPLKHVSLLYYGEFTAKERLSICCKPSFRLRRLKNKGAILVLIWSYLYISLLYFYQKINEDNNRVEFNIHVITLGLTLSIAGWIADVSFGRYRVMYLSMWITWASLILATMSSVLTRTVDSYTSNIYSYVNGVLWSMMVVGFGGFQANVIQLGIDQLHDASTDEIASFIFWYIWTYDSSGFVIYFILGCLPKQYWIVWQLVMCIYLSIALSSMLMFNHWLVKESVTQNPFKLVYSVVRYVIKHKHPECRSAFTYCEDEPPSRVDFGKSKYGGPFTTERVEDVKTFLRLIGVMFVGTMMSGVIFASWQLLANMLYMLTDISNTKDESLLKCYSKEAFIEILANSCVVMFPLYELFIYPSFHRCLEMMKSHWKFILGVLLLIADIIALLVIETVGRYKYLESTNYNTTIPCIGHGTLSTSMDFRWMAIPLFLHSLSASVFGIGAIEFIASQAPYSMRGLIMGTAYCMFALCAAVGIGISIPFTRQLSIWGTGIISCGFWYALLLLVVEVLAGFMFTAIQKWYKKRKREDVLPNEHIFAERYYDRDT